MQPIKQIQTSSSYLPEDELEEQVGTLTINDDDPRQAGLDLAESTRRLREVMDLLNSTRETNLLPATQANRVGNGNNNNEPYAAYEARNRADPDQDPDLDLLRDIAPNISSWDYENTQSLLPFLSEAHEETGNSPLHAAVNLLIKKPKSYDILIVLITALLESGANKESPNFKDETPFQLACDTEDELLLQLFTHEKPNKETLLQLAKEHNREKFVDELEMPDFMGAFVKEAESFLETITSKNTVTDLYNHVLEFYSRHSKVISFVYPTSQNTLLHTAVQAYVDGFQVGIFEAFVMITCGANKHHKNSKGESPFSIAESSNDPFLIEFMKCERPTRDDLEKIVRNNPVLNAWLNSFEG